MIRDLLNEYFDTGVLPQLEDEQDPFWDPEEPIHIGNALLKLESLGYLLDNPHEAQIMGQDIPGNVGKIHLNIIPTDENGSKEIPEEMEPEEPEDLLGKRVHFDICVDSIKGLPKEASNNVFVKYAWFLDKQSVFTD